MYKIPVSQNKINQFTITNETIQTNINIIIKIF